ncbi:MAG: Gfo/Idh/MocA family oxidoreductase [Chthoniobacterales bacterium]|nr:Gfo/Idh/MocA family oxidoreductase [Chthoniobacterales bacterium]
MKDASPLRIGVIGAGWWATSAHIPAINAHPRARLVAVQSRSQDKADKVARDFGAAHAVTDPFALLELPGLDAVVIATTPNMHHVQAKAALERGKHVLLEKPMTFTAAEAKELCELAEAKGVQLLISCPWHFTPHGMEVREMIRRGDLGEIRMISVLMTNPIDKLLKGINTTPTHGQADVYIEPCIGSYNDPAIAGGGQIYCQISHAAAYLTFLTGLRPVEVYARFENEGSVNDIYDALTVTMENGALVTVASTGATPMSERNYEVRVYGTRGIVLLELWKGEAVFIPFEGERRVLPPIPAAGIYPERGPLDNFVDAVLGLAPNGSDGRLGFASMQVIEAAVQSSKTNLPVKVFL